ncbi:MAG TPA: heparan-alpha-glucosaminide N-acetyltransferase [Candidatus Aminicenantes bacterium]|nr:heparan-alpha-glucosaminide N-acetyltransferase [Candidatus Aminicenantes bacterium]HRY65855.1 heparan-alpha-glucosaminide N-acetyltransferase [Candidatus Aminicenantes bacterium]HRZ72819.1 heparan-alpha-glucosaminide N-acetyltransferase [Candidatus Aminicenantes bacterium]
MPETNAPIPAARTAAARPPRIWEIDFLRGVSIILVIGYHLLYDVGDYLGMPRFLGWTTDLSSPAWTIAQHFFAGLFVLLSGVSSTLTRSNVRRGLRLLAVALALTLATYLIAVWMHLFDPADTILFGILHCLAVSILLYGLVFAKVPAAANALIGAAIVGLAPLLPALGRALAVRSNWLIPFGLPGPSFSSLDYFPLIPWLGVFLIGASLGRSVYAARKSLLPWRMPRNIVNFAGRHSLLIYLVHQPVIMGVLYVAGRIR